MNTREMMMKTTSFIFVLALGLAVVGCGSKKNSATNSATYTNPYTYTVTTPTTTTTTSGKSLAEIESSIAAGSFATLPSTRTVNYVHKQQTAKTSKSWTLANIFNISFSAGTTSTTVRSILVGSNAAGSYSGSSDITSDSALETHLLNFVNTANVVVRTELNANLSQYGRTLINTSSQYGTVYHLYALDDDGAVEKYMRISFDVPLQANPLVESDEDGTTFSSINYVY